MNKFLGTAEQRDNLEKLAAYLELPQLLAAFDMSSYGDCDCLDAEEYDVENCGTCGCSVGHGPYAGIEKRPGEDWPGYSERVFVPPPVPGKMLDSIEQWEWMFSATWAEVDNTPQGAAKRIRWLLERGCPENVKEQIEGTEPLCYVELRPRSKPGLPPHRAGMAREAIRAADGEAEA